MTSKPTSTVQKLKVAVVSSKSRFCDIDANLKHFAERAIYARAYILINNSAGDMPHPGGVTGFGSGPIIIDPLGQAIARTTQKTRSEKMLAATLIKPLNQVMPDFEITRFND